MIGTWVWEVLCVLFLSIMGGVLNHMRGSGGGMLRADAFAGERERE